jgi:hypothetical protein
MTKEMIQNAEELSLVELKHMVFAAESHGIPVVPATGPCGGCDLVLKPQEVANGPCGGCDVVTRPKELADGPCGGCDIMKPTK